MVEKHDWWTTRGPRARETEKAKLMYGWYGYKIQEFFAFKAKQVNRKCRPPPISLFLLNLRIRNPLRPLRLHTFHGKARYPLMLHPRLILPMLLGAIGVERLRVVRCARVPGTITPFADVRSVAAGLAPWPEWSIGTLSSGTLWTGIADEKGSKNWEAGTNDGRGGFDDGPDQCNDGSPWRR